MSIFIEGDDGDMIFPRVLSMEKRWEEIRNNLKFWGFTHEPSQGGGVNVTRCRDDKTVNMLHMELYDAGTSRKHLEAFFN